MTDCLGLLLVVAVSAANVGDRDAAVGLLQRLRRLHRDICLVWADGGYTGGLAGWCRQKLAFTLQVVKRTDDKEVRGAAEALGGRKKLGWLMRSRRLARDYETRADSAEAMILCLMTMVMSRHLARRRRAGTVPARP